MNKRILSEDEIIEAACYLVLPYERSKEKTESMFRKIVIAAREYGLDLSPEFYASLSEERLRHLVINAYRVTHHYSPKWFGDDGIINKLKPLPYKRKLHIVFALHEYYCAQAEGVSRSAGCNIAEGKA